MKFEWCYIPGASVDFGSSFSEIAEVYSFWLGRLISGAYKPEALRSWLEKEFPVHSRDIRRFAILKYPITNKQFYSFASEGNDSGIFLDCYLESKSDHPAIEVSLQSALKFANWAAAKTNQRLRLPTEWEWEYAARGRERLQFPYGEVFDPNKANSIESQIGDTTPVDRYYRYPSPFRVCDLAGNAEEWTGSLYAPYPGGRAIKDDIWHATAGAYNVLRGGCFALGGDLTRCARRHGPGPYENHVYWSFRLVREL